jgi:opacity protein-like surface antigen
MRIGLVLVLSISCATAQGLGIGVKGGVPFSDVFKATGETGLLATEISHTSTQRFTLGPMLEVRLPFGLGVEFDALYKRFDQTGESIHVGSTVMKTGNSWEFPLLGKYRIGRSFAKPYVEAGVSFNHLSGYLVPFRTLPNPPSSQPEASTTRTGVALGVGIELKLRVVRISPGIRFSHWGDHFPVPGTNPVDFLLGVSL